MNNYDSSKIAYRGRRKIYTDQVEINESNVQQVLCNSLIYHEKNRAEITYLMNYEAGEQPLKRQKLIRDEIDIKDIPNLAHVITSFWKGYEYGNHVANVQRCSTDNPDRDKDNKGISLLNTMYSVEGMLKKDQKLANFLLITGVCPQMIDIKRHLIDEDDSLFDLVTLDPRFAFVVYSSTAYEKPVMGVSFAEKDDGSTIYTCITESRIYVLDNLVLDKDKKERTWAFDKTSGQLNPFGVINIIEFERAPDRTGVFERQIDEMNALAIQCSDLANDVAQTCQAMWWGNDIDLPTDDEGKVKKPVGGQWIVTNTAGDGAKPDIKPLTLNYDYNGVIANITEKHDQILKHAFVPLTSDSQGGGSNTGAAALSSGWTAAEAVAKADMDYVIPFFEYRNRLALIACKKNTIPKGKREEYKPLLELSASDIEVAAIRQKTFDMATKVNSLATMIQNFVDPRVAMETVGLFPNLEEAVEESEKNMRKYQKNLLKEDKETQKIAPDTLVEGRNGEVEELSTQNAPDKEKTMEDSSDQISKEDDI